MECALESWRNWKAGGISEFSQGNWGPTTADYICGLGKISDTRWKKILSEMQQFIPHKPREETAGLDNEDNYRTKVPESGKPTS